MSLLPSHGGTVIVILRILALVDESETRRWFGPNMCKQLCEYTFGCSEYEFSSCHLTCRIQSQSRHLQGAKFHPHKRQSDSVVFAALNKSCAMYSRIFYSRTGTLFCGTRVNTVSGKEQRVSPAILSNLLVTEYMSPTQRPFYKFHMDSKSATLYSNLTSRKVKAVGYLGSLRRVLLSLTDPPRLSYFTIGDNKVVTMKSNILCTAMSVDETRNIILLAVGLPRSSLHTMTPDGQDDSLLFNISQPYGDNYDYPTALAMDLSRHCVYICLRNKVLSADLTKSTLSVIFHGSSLQCMDFDPLEDVLYLGKRSEVFRLSLITNSTRSIPLFKSKVFSMLYYLGHIYASLFYLDSLITVSVQNKKKDFHRLSTKSDLKPVIFCRID